MDQEIITVLERVSLALLAGGIIGLERAYHGRPAGFRTHSLVCCSSSLLMLLAVFQWQLLPDAPLDTIRVDPTRMAQGIMTGIGFLGAGVIMKEQLTVRGLTTAASIWMTATLGIIIGMGFYSAALAGSIITLLTLTVFNRIESALPSILYGKLTVRIPKDKFLSENELESIISKHSIKSLPPSMTLNSNGNIFEYKMTISASTSAQFTKLADTLRCKDGIHEFSVEPIGN